MKKILNSSRFKSIIINAVILAALLLFTHTVYETNDDHTIAKMLVAGNANIGFVNYYICKVLIAIQSLLPGVNVFVYSQIVASYIAFVVILRIIMDRSTSLWLHAAATALIAVFAIDHYVSIQFTKTSALLITAGFILIMNSALSKGRWTEYLEAVILVVVGSGYRWNTLLPSLGFLCAFAGVYAFVTLIEGIREKKIKEKMATLRPLLVCGLVVVIAYGCAYGFDMASRAANTSTEQLRIAKEYRSLRARITDFPTDDLYYMYKDECDEINVDANDIQLIHKWLFDYDGAASIENLRVLSSLGKEASTERLTAVECVKKTGRGIIRSFQQMDYTGWHLALLILISLLIVCAADPKDWLYVLGFGGLALCEYLVLYYMQRPLYRTLYIADVGAMAWLMFTAAAVCRKSKPLPKVMAVILIAACCLAVPSEAAKLENRHNKFVNKTRPVELDEYFKEHSDSVFVCEVNGWNNAATYATPLRVSTNKRENEVSTGGWSTLSPYQMERLASFGMTNPVKDLINNDKAYFVGNARLDELREYYNKWYGDEDSTVEFILIDTVGGKKIWRIVKN